MSEDKPLAEIIRRLYHLPLEFKLEIREVPTLDANAGTDPLCDNSGNLIGACIFVGPRTNRSDKLHEGVHAKLWTVG